MRFRSVFLTTRALFKFVSAAPYFCFNLLTQCGKHTHHENVLFIIFLFFLIFFLLFLNIIIISLNASTVVW